MPQDNQVARKRKPLTQLTLEEATGSRKKSKTANSNHDSPPCSRRAGTVNYIILKNFMCHSLLEVDFKQKNISMVIGKNGSGKSALLTALIVGLGGKASLTNRGSSIKGFVKVGRPSGSVEIQLCNEGPMAYRPRMYGKSITIIRNLTASGGGSYRVKSVNGEIISTQAKEVSNIASNLNIQVDNPVCLLTQDTSRNFLSSNDPKNKFTLFMKATKLEMLETEYRAIVINKKECVRILADKKNNFAKLQEEIRRLKRKIDGHQSIVTLKEKKLTLQSEMMWAQVRDVEEEIAEEQRKLDRIIKKLEDVEIASTKKLQEIKDLRENIREYERQIADIKEQLEIQKQRQTDSKKELEELQNSYNQAKRKNQGLAIEIDAKTKDAEYLQKEIANANENMSKVEQQKNARMKSLSNLQDKLKGADEHLETVRNDLFQIKNDIARKQDDEGNLKSDIRQVDQRIGHEESSLQALQRESGNILLLYGRTIPKVKEMINQQKRSFQHEPKGPLGSYMRLKDKKWAVAAEGYFGGNMLAAFTVDNQKDGKLLQQMFSKCMDGEHQPTIITSKFLNRKHDVTNNLVEAPKDCISLYDAVIIDDTVVSNCLVDQLNTENILLIPSGERAMELMSDRRMVPRNCKQGLTIKGDRYYPDPNYKTYASSYHKARYLQIDTKEHMQHLQETIANMKNRKQEIQTQLHVLQRDVHNQELKQRELEDKIRKVTSAKKQIRTQYDDLSNEAEPEVHDLNILENELRDIKVTLTEKKKQIWVKLTKKCAKKKLK